jgi:hypothetical protein
MVALLFLITKEKVNESDIRLSNFSDKCRCLSYKLNNFQITALSNDFGKNTSSLTNLANKL